MIFVSGELLNELLRSLAAGDPASLQRMKSHLECLRGDEPYIERVSEVTRQLIERDAHGQRKYGTSLDRTDLSLGDWLQHQAEELMDGAGYALAAKREYERLVAPATEAQLDRAARAMCYFSTGAMSTNDSIDSRDPTSQEYWMELARISAGVFK